MSFGINVAELTSSNGLAIIRKSSERIARQLAPKGTDTAPIVDGIIAKIKTTTDR